MHYAIDIDACYLLCFMLYYANGSNMIEMGKTKLGNSPAPGAPPGGFFRPALSWCELYV